MPKRVVMSLFDFLIIYLSLGAPFAVCFYLQNRKAVRPRELWLKTILNFVFWIPFAYQLIRKSDSAAKFFSNIFDNQSFSDAEREKNITLARKNLEMIFAKNGSKRSIFEFRETLERYTGLTLAGQIDERNSQNERPDFEIFSIAGSSQKEIAARCLQRRNRKRLFFHHTQSRRSFLALLAELFDTDSESERLKKAAIDFVTLLEDGEALAAIDKMFGSQTQTPEMPNVVNAETELWKSGKPQPPTIDPISTRLQILTTTAATTTTNSRGRD